MKKNTFEDYKKAIKAKYEIEREGVYFNFFTPTSQANLRNLCWERLKENDNKDDRSIFSSFFGFEFDNEKKNNFNQHTDRFRPICSFLKGEKVPSNRYAVELAAILVDYEPRPFKKFKERGIPMVEQPIGSPKIPFAFGIKREDEIEIEGIDLEKENLNYQEEQIANPANEETFTYTEEKEKEVEIEQIKPKRINLFLNIKEKLLNKLKRKIKVTALGVAIVLSVGFAAIYEFFPEKGCMQWTGNNYEIVDCDLKAADNNIELLDPNQINMKRIKACDTTAFFKNEKAVVFYARSRDSLECFNQIGYHPERKSLYLKPITNHMIGKYVSNKPCK